MDFFTLAKDVGFPIAGALAAGGFVFLTLKFILAGVTGSDFNHGLHPINLDTVKQRANMRALLRRISHLGGLCRAFGNLKHSLIAAALGQ